MEGKGVVAGGAPPRQLYDGMKQQAMNMGDKYVCNFAHQINSRGIWLGDDPFNFSVPLFMIQVTLVSTVIRSIYLFLKPLGQPLIISQILGGVILGPSFLGSNSTFAGKVFPVKGRIVLETVSLFGFTLCIFLIGVRIDPTMVLKTGKRALAIGMISFIVPYTMAGIVAIILSNFLSLDEDLVSTFSYIVGLLSFSAFPVIACFLTELKILNSEIGRLASSSSMVCDACHWSIMSLKFFTTVARMRSLKSLIGSIVSSSLLILLIVFGIRPAALWTIRHTPEGKPVKDVYIFLLLVVLLCCGFMGEALGMSSLSAAFLLGLVIPDGPPLAAALVEKLDCFVSVLLMPAFFAVCGSNMDIFAIQNLRNVVVIQSIVFAGFLGKTIGTILPPLFYRMPFRDAMSLALIMNSRGIVELGLLIDMKRSNMMNEECFAIMVISVVIITGIISPVVKILYDPSKGYLAYKRRTMFHSKGNEELRILACIHSQDNVQAMVNLLDASSPTKESPINLVVLHLVNLVGSASSLLIAYHPREKTSPSPNQSEHIFNAFRKFEHHNRSAVHINCFKGISPLTTMHNDVCSIALEKRTTFVILPFHKQWYFGEWVEGPNALRHLNRNVLDKAPCSVGILIDRGNHRPRLRALIAEPPVRGVIVLFFGGADDREALAFARRVSEHPNVRLTLLRFLSESCCCSSSLSSEIVQGTERSKMLDMEILNDFKERGGGRSSGGGGREINESVCYREEVVRDGMGVAAAVTKSLMENNEEYDLVIVGRRHGESRVISDLRNCGTDECEEVGAVGKLLLASSDRKPGASVLVVQQQTRVWGMLDTEESTHLRKVKF